MHIKKKIDAYGAIYLKKKKTRYNINVLYLRQNDKITSRFPKLQMYHSYEKGPRDHPMRQRNAIL